METADHSSPVSRSVALVGCGNIGSQVVAHLARMPEVRRVLVIDRDIYEPSNLWSQEITSRDIGKAKAVVQSARLRRINPSLRVKGISESVESVPLGMLRADVIIACLDSRRSRQYVNQAAWRLGVPLIDTGISADGLLARVNGYLPGQDTPCLECAWDEMDYRLLEQVYPCPGFREVAVATNAPSSLGALAASLQAIECRKLLVGERDKVLFGRQVLIDALYHKHYVTTFRRNTACRFDHEVWSIERLEKQPDQITLGEALSLAGSGNGDAPPLLGVEGSRFVKRLVCQNCRNTSMLLRLHRSLQPAEHKCARCGQEMLPAGFDLCERLKADELSEEMQKRSLGSVGLKPGDVFTVGANHYQLKCDSL